MPTICDQVIKLRIVSVKSVQKLIELGEAENEKQALSMIMHRAKKHNVCTGFKGDSLVKVYAKYMKFKKHHNSEIFYE